MARTAKALPKHRLHATTMAIFSRRTVLLLAVLASVVLSTAVVSEVDKDTAVLVSEPIFPSPWFYRVPASGFM